MASQFPSVIANLTYPNANQPLSNPSHSSIHGAVNDEIEQIENFIGTTSSSVLGTLIHDIRSPASGGGGHIQTPQYGGTGQVMYNKGDILVGQSASVLSRLAVSSVNGASLVSDSTQPAGLNWRTSAALDYQVFTANGVWNKPSLLSGLEITHIQLWGAGGGTASFAGTYSGGGGGSFVQIDVPTTLLTSSMLVVVAPSVLYGVTGSSTLAGSYIAYGGGPASGTTGGGGGGVLGPGSTPNGGKPFGATQPGEDSSFGGGGGGNSSSVVGGFSADGGGGGSYQTAGGGNSFRGGGGGGNQAGNGLSQYGGNGAIGSSSAAGIPAGGGYGSFPGARGEARIWTI